MISTKRNGFTLIEVIMAFMILAGTMVVLLQSRSSALQSIMKGRTYTNVTFLLQSKITEFEIKNREKTVDELKETDAGDFDGFPDYAWEIKLQPMVIPSNIFPKSEEPNEMAQMIFKTVTEYFEKAVREVLITVVDKKLKKRYSVSTIFIDYKKEIPTGM